MFDYKRERLDADSEPVPTNKKLETCYRCQQSFWRTDCIKVGERYYCKFCYDPPYGEGVHRRGDFVD